MQRTWLVWGMAAALMLFSSVATAEEAAWGGDEERSVWRPDADADVSVSILDIDPSLAGVVEKNAGQQAAEVEQARQGLAEVRYGARREAAPERRDSPEISPRMSSGELRVKLYPGHRLEKRGESLRLADAADRTIGEEETRALERAHRLPRIGS